MAPQLFYSLSNVYGFNNLNGKTYKEHITIILKDHLTDEDNEKIMNSATDEEALTCIPFEITHEYQ